MKLKPQQSQHLTHFNTANQTTGFYMKCDSGLKWDNRIEK